MKKKEVNKWEPECDEVWVETDKTIEPSPYFLKWWQDLSFKKYGDNTNWLQVAVDLGYVSKQVDSKSGKMIFEPIGFDYDIQLVRKTLDMSSDMPIIRYAEIGQDEYKRMIDLLFHNDGDNNDK